MLMMILVSVMMTIWLFVDGSVRYINNNLHDQ